jgi:TonB-linked SusC/RagA family outer membrane protein
MFMRKMKTLLIVLMVLLEHVVALAQTLVIAGRVSDDQGNGVSFATVALKGSTRAVSADKDGNFKIDAQKGSTLIISAASFETKEILINDVSFITVAVNKADKLQEVVVTALGIKRTKNSLPYATQQIKADELNRVPNTNFINNLSGKVAGLQITSSNALGGSANVILRGAKSLTQSNQALFVVDGVPYDNTTQNQSGYDLGNVAADINPDDIESVTVLKGAAASALYGSRASNGVIVITTKKGGRKNNGLGITINEGIQIGSPDKSTLPKYQTQYGQGYGSAGATSPDGFFYYAPAVGSNGQNVSIVETDEDQVWGSAFNKNLLVYQWDAFSPGNANFGKATPWVSAPNHSATDFFVTPVTNTTSIYVDGGGDKGTFKAGYTNSYDGGLLPNSKIKKNILNFGATYNIADNFTIGGTFNYVDESGLNRNSYDFRAVQSTMRDFRQWWPTNINLKEQKADYFRNRTNNAWNILGGYATAAPDNLPGAAYHNNAYWTAYENYNNDSRQRYFGNINLNYKINDFLNILGRVSKDNYNQLFETRVAVGSYQTPSYSKYLGSYSETNYDLLINLDKNITKDINLKALLGGNVRQDVNSSTYSITNGGLVVPRFYALSNSKKTPAAPTETYSEKEVDGVFAGATLSYKQLITIDATVRRDQSSTLPKGNNAYYYPAVSGNFIFSKLLPDLTWLSYAKLRANYAEVGGDAPVYSLQNTYNPGTAFNGQTVFSYTSTNNNPNLVPEKNKTYEFGLETYFLKNRLGIDVTYYHSQLVNQITPISPSTATGFTNFFVNGGTIQNQGFEVVINAVAVKERNFEWDITLNWSKNQNKVISLFNNQPSYTIASFQNSIQLVAETGKAYGILRGTDYQYLNGQRLIDANGYPVKATNTKSDIGNINPGWIGGITNTFRYENFSLSFLIDVKQGGSVYSLDMDYGEWSGVYEETSGKNSLGNPIRSPLSTGGGIVLKGVTPDGKQNTTRVDAYDINADGSNFPFSSVNSLAAKSYVYDASYVKLREVAFTYSLPKSIIGKINFIKGLDISLTGRNLWIIHKNLPYSDPEQAEASTTLSGSAPIVYNPNANAGYQTGAFPSVRQLGFNVKIKF